MTSAWSTVTMMNFIWDECDALKASSVLSQSEICPYNVMTEISVSKTWPTLRQWSKAKDPQVLEALPQQRQRREGFTLFTESTQEPETLQTIVFV